MKILKEKDLKITKIPELVLLKIPHILFSEHNQYSDTFAISFTKTVVSLCKSKFEFRKMMIVFVMRTNVFGGFVEDKSSKLGRKISKVI